ncbi:hypothetical protein LTR84_003535 [Exophiala bonariae]|uniref:LIM zinc-binding domain-containing protein n=1 Tax=Exophiala bonariae TaxID=1690606 RepID=A0AAV9N797_9EURO|nr:hypothetical protein LTR84_003535 [Exophiala bonariae]
MEAMDLPTRSASFRPVIKCSQCGSDIALDAVAAHQCSTTSPTSSTAFPPLSTSSTIPPPLPRTDSSNSLKNIRQQRPLLPKIDPAAAFRPPVYPGELTPGSSGHSSMVSPLSASSGSRSPFSNLRKGSLPGPRRPPSPELTNLDCAFPPFPTANKPVASKRRERAVTQHSDSKRSRSRDTSRNFRQPKLAPPPLARAATSDNFAQIPPERPNPDKYSRPSTASSHRNASISTNGESTKASNDELGDSVDLSHSQTLSRTGDQHDTTNNMPFSAPLSKTATEPDLSRGRAMDPNLNAFDFGDTQNEPLSQSHAAAPSGVAEPSYKSKRPSPINSDRQASALPQLNGPTTPQPTSAGVFSKSLGRLFGRRRSQSATSRREVARQALSDEPDEYTVQPMDRPALSPNSERSLITGEPSPTTIPSPLRSPAPASSVEEALRQLSGHEESLSTLETQAAASMAAPVVVVEPAQEAGSTSILSTSPEVVDRAALPVIMEMETEARLRNSHDVQRASIDSASSYGSVGFSEHSISTRSSSPQADAPSASSVEGAYSSLVKAADADVPAPLRPRVPTVPALAPGPMLEVEPLKKGRSSFIEETEGPQNDIPNVLVTPTSNKDAVASNASEPEPSWAPRSTSKGTAPNKGICRGCNQTIQSTQKSVSSADGRLSGRYHKECFVCWMCKSPFPTAEFYVYSDHPYCGHHYHELEDSLCATCGLGIEGLYMETHNVAGRGREKHHPDCLKCTTCQVRLDHDYFELSGKVYCERDAFRLATMPKPHENAPTRPSPLIREYISSGDPGLIKGRNFPERRITRLMNMT